MSLIFKALKKLKEQPDADNQDPSPQKERYVYSFRKLMLSPVLIAALLGVLVVVGFGFYYVNLPVGKPPAKLIATKAISPSSASVPDKTTSDNGGTYMAKAAPDNLEPDDPAEMPAAVGDKADENVDMPESQPPSGSKESVVSMQRTKADQESEIQIPDQQSHFMPRTPAPEGTATQASNTPSPKPSKAPPPDPERPATPQMEVAAADADRKIQKSRPVPKAQSALTKAADKPSSKAYTAKTDHQKAASSNQKSTRAKVLRNKKAKQVRITRLVTRIEKQMHLYEDEETWRLIGELEALKGSENTYVLKLKAYWHLRRDEFDAAVVLLNKVLQKNAEDLEAGINMAVAEMKTNQFAAAEERLDKLREVYPENSLIPEMLHKLR